MFNANALLMVFRIGIVHVSIIKEKKDCQELSQPLLKEYG